MIDSGAKNSAISLDLLSGRSTFIIRPPLSYRNIDGTVVGNVVGETSITVRYKGVLVDLNHVAVVKSMLYPLVFGIEWIVQSGAVVKGVCGRAEVLMPGDPATIEKEIQGAPKEEPVPQNSDRPSATEEEELSTESDQSLSEEGGTDASSEEADHLRILGAIVDEASYNAPSPPADVETHQDRLTKVIRWRRTARALVVQSQRRSKAYSDKYRKPDPVFRPGDLVLIARHRRALGRTKKLNPRFIGPYQIAKRVSATCYMVEDWPCNRRRRRWRRFKARSSQIRRYHPRREVDWLPEDNYSDGDDENGIVVRDLHSPVDCLPEPVPEYGAELAPMVVPVDPLPDADAANRPEAVVLPHSDGAGEDPFHGFEAGPDRVATTRSNRRSRPAQCDDFLYYYSLIKHCVRILQLLPCSAVDACSLVPAVGIVSLGGSGYFRAIDFLPFCIPPLSFPYILVLIPFSLGSIVFLSFLFVRFGLLRRDKVRRP